MTFCGLNIRFSVRGEWFARPVALAMCVALWGGGMGMAHADAPQSDALKIGRLQAQVYYRFRYLRDYPPSQCRVAYNIEWDDGTWVPFGDIYWNIFSKYLYLNAPEASQISEVPGQLDGKTVTVVEFMGRCDRRYELMGNILDLVQAKYPDARITLYSEQQGEDIVPHRVDDPYPRHLILRKAALRECSAAAWVKVARFHETEILSDPEGYRRYYLPLIYFILAAQLMPTEQERAEIEPVVVVLQSKLPKTELAKLNQIIDAFFASGGCGKT